jgi:hypothetical protein
MSQRIRSAVPSKRSDLTSAKGSRGIPRPESAAMYGGMSVSGTGYDKQVKDAKENRNTKNTAAVTVDDLERIKEMCALGRQDSDA